MQQGEPNPRQSGWFALGRKSPIVDVFLGEWVNLLLRWAHMIVGIGWIGTSFYFMALDYSLDQRSERTRACYGTAWQVHGGGFYHVEKYTVAPPKLPDVLHWFKWEAYLTWVTGFGLLIVQYYFHADAYLIDPGVMPLDPLAGDRDFGRVAGGRLVHL